MQGFIISSYLMKVLWTLSMMWIINPCPLCQAEMGSQHKNVYGDVTTDTSSKISPWCINDPQENAKFFGIWWHTFSKFSLNIGSNLPNYGKFVGFGENLAESESDGYMNEFNFSW